MRQLNSPPLENLLRPPLEWITTLLALLYAALIVHWPHVFRLYAQTAQAGSIVLLIFGIGRGYQGYHVWRYQRRLRGQPPYTLPADNLPYSQRTLLLGRGFWWTPIHTQRLRDLDQPENQRYRNTHQTFKPSDVGGETALHGVNFKEYRLRMPLKERSGHTLVLGTTGVGKTRCAEWLISQDILRGDAVIVIDPKGDGALFRQLLMAAQAAHRLHDMRVFHLGFPEYSLSYNPIGRFNDISEVAGRITQPLPSGGDSDAFKAFAWQFVHLVATILDAMGETPTYKNILHHVMRLDALETRFWETYLPQKDDHFSNWIQTYQTTYRSKHDNPPTRKQAMRAYIKAHGLETDPLIDQLHHACRYEQTYYDKITASLCPLLKKLTSGSLSTLLSPKDQNNNSLQWEEAIQDKHIVYVGLDALSNPTVASAVGAALLSDLTSLAGNLYKSTDCHPSKTAPRICLHVDEFNDVIGDEFIPLLNKARGVGFQVTAYTQTWSDVEARLRSPAKAGQVAGNFNTLVMMRIKEAKTAQQLLSALPQGPYRSVIPASSGHNQKQGDIRLFQSHNEDRLQVQSIPLLTTHDLFQLPKGHAFILLDGAKLMKCRMPQLISNKKDIPYEMKSLLHWLQHKTASLD